MVHASRSSLTKLTLGNPLSILIATLTLLILGSFLQRAFGHFKNRDVDFFVYYFAGQVVHDNPKADIYAGALDGNPEAHNDAPPTSDLHRKADAAGFKEIMLYLYPPILADMLAPLNGLSPPVAARLWRILNLGLILLSLLALARMLSIKILSAPFAVFALAAYCFFPITEALAVGQITLVLLALWAVAVVGYREDKVALSACALAFATTLKITPLLVLPIFLIWKDKRWLAWYAAALTALILAMAAINGAHTVETSLRVIGAMGTSVAAMQNKCISSLMAWLYHGRFIPMESGSSISPPRLLVLAEKATSLAFYLLCLTLVWRRRSQRDRFSRATTFAIFALVSAAVSPISWRHAYAIALVPLSILWVQTLRIPTTMLHRMLLAFATLATGSLVFDLTAQRPLPHALQILSASMLTVSIILLCIEVLRVSPAPDSLEVPLIPSDDLEKVY